MSKGSTSNSIFDRVLSLIDYSNQNIFLTGKAGTGKTTLLRKIRESCGKKMVVLAPTGVAAMNAKGTTINSFFQLAPGILSIPSMISDLSYSKEKLNLFNELELLVIDEVSMVRCDLMDVIDAILRTVRKNSNPFGGVQLLLIGDLYQLPPVTKREDWSLLSRTYPSPYFFDALVIRKHPLLQIELTTVFRQTEPEFIGILNDIRNNQISESSLTLLNKRYDPHFSAKAEVYPIIITSHNAEANTINKEKLDELPGIAYTFEGETSGEFKDLSLQAEQTLILKEGAQIMFIKNDTGDDRKFYNGKIGKVKSIVDGEILVSFTEEEDLLLKKTTWVSFEYQADPEQAIVQQQVGEFSQYPVKLAWAVTIHKSQGLTFDSAIIDAGKSFIAGQVYVALSRVRTLNGLVLKSKISTESLRSNLEVINYMRPVAEDEMEAMLTAAQEKFILQITLNYFSFGRIVSEAESIAANPEIAKSHLPEFSTLLLQLGKSATELMSVADRFQSQVNQLYTQTGFADQQALQTRIASALDYFKKEITLQLLNPLNKNIRLKPKNKVQQHVQHVLIKYRQLIEIRIALMQMGSESFKQPIRKEDYKAWIDKHKVKPSVKAEASSAVPQAITLQLF